MPKPIFIVELPHTLSSDNCQIIQKDLETKFLDYNVLVYISYKDEPSFQVFYEKDFNEVKFQELKQLVIDNIKKAE